MTFPDLTNPRTQGVTARRFQQMSTFDCTAAGLSLATTRILGLWVPAEMFGPGGSVEVTVAHVTTSTQLRLSIGGDASAVNLGVSALFPNSPTASSALWAKVGIDVPGDFVATLLSGGGGWIGTTSSVSNWTANIHIQPLNFVELSTAATFSITHASLIVTSPSSPNRFTADFTLGV